MCTCVEIHVDGVVLILSVHISQVVLALPLGFTGS